MRSGTRKVADSKPDATARKESDTIPMTDIGKITFGIHVCAFIQTFLLPSHPNFYLIIYVAKFLVFIFPFLFLPSPLTYSFF